MEAALPADISAALSAKAVAQRRKPGPFRVKTGDQVVQVTDLARDGFVIEADGRPPLRGYADIFRGDECILRGLVVCSWARDGLVGYEFKRGTTDGTVPADYARGPVVGLLPSA